MTTANQTLGERLTDEVSSIFRDRWTKRAGEVVPEAENLRLGNDSVTLKGTVLYADLADSTGLVSSQSPEFAAEVYKAYLHCAAKIVRSEGGEITAYDGDRLMAVYIHDRKNTAAARTALKLNYAVTQIINPALKAQYPNTNYVVRQAVGIDTSDLLIARTGVRGANDLVWVGRAANYAAKLCSLRWGEFASWITASVYNSMHQDAKSSGGNSMWEARSWTAMGGVSIYRSYWKWPI